MSRAQFLGYLVVSIVSVLSTIVLTSSTLFDGLIGRNKVRLEIQKLSSDLSKYEEVAAANIDQVRAETSLALENVEALSSTLGPQIAKLELETQVIQREMTFNSLANDLALIRGLRPVVSTEGVRQKTLDSRKIDFLLLIKNTGTQVIRVDDIWSRLECNGEVSHKEAHYQNWPIGAGDTFEVDPPAMDSVDACGGCEMVFSFVASSDPIAIRLLENRYPEILRDFSDFFSSSYSYRFNC